MVALAAVLPRVVELIRPVGLLAPSPVVNAVFSARANRSANIAGSIDETIAPVSSSNSRGTNTTPDEYLWSPSRNPLNDGCTSLTAVFSLISEPLFAVSSTVGITIVPPASVTIVVDDCNIEP